MSLVLLMVTSDPALAGCAIQSGVDRVFVDLETRGKADRQRGLGMHLSDSQLEDVSRVRAVVPAGRLLVRINAPWERTADEVEAVVSAGADFVMVPMFRTAEEIARACEAASGRAVVVPLVETAEAAAIARSVMALDGVGEAYVGLNDLALSFGQRFLFRAMLDERFGALCEDLQESGKPFGIGGIGRMGTGDVPADLLLGEYLRRGASRVILSRAFRDGAETLEGVRAAIDLPAEVDRVRSAASACSARTAGEAGEGWAKLQRAIDAVAVP